VKQPQRHDPQPSEYTLHSEKFQSAILHDLTATVCMSGPWRIEGETSDAERHRVLNYVPAKDRAAFKAFLAPLSLADSVRAVGIIASRRQDIQAGTLTWEHALVAGPAVTERQQKWIAGLFKSVKPPGIHVIGLFCPNPQCKKETIYRERVLRSLGLDEGNSYESTCASCRRSWREKM
jgi:hypothetical protein